MDADENQIHADDNQFSADGTQYNLDLSAVQNDVQAVNTDWTNLQNAAKANATGMPAPTYVQNDIDTALTNAQDAENTAQDTRQSAQTTVTQYDNEASTLQKKADALPASMHCS